MKTTVTAKLRRWKKYKNKKQSSQRLTYTNCIPKWKIAIHNLSLL